MHKSPIIMAVLLASVGLFGVISYNAARRTSEIGIQMALGASRMHVVWLVLNEALFLVIAGIVIGHCPSGNARSGSTHARTTGGWSSSIAAFPSASPISSAWSRACRARKRR